MNTKTLLILTVAAMLVACGKQGPVEPEQPVVEEEAEQPADAPLTFDQAFIDHMHAHAEQLDELMFALADDDLEGASTPAYWLSRHEAVDGVSDELQQYISGMREAARDVGRAATDLETAKAAAERLSDQCQYCHNAAGIDGTG